LWNLLDQFTDPDYVFEEDEALDGGLFPETGSKDEKKLGGIQSTLSRSTEDLNDLLSPAGILKYLLNHNKT
jgi:hypothetical protein